MVSLVVFRDEMTVNSWLDTFYLPDKLALIDFDEIWDLHPENQNKIFIYGEEKTIPRYQKSYIRDYEFSGATSKSDPLPDLLKPFLKWINRLDYGKFNQFLLNWYENGENYIGSHADDEKQLVPNSPIVTITLCEEGLVRVFRVRDKKTKKIVQDIETPNGIVLVMGGHFQKEFKHEIVKMTGSKAPKAGRRISITLRQFK